MLVVGRDPEHDGALAFELAVDVADPARLRRATGSVILGVEVEDDLLAAQVGQADRLPGVGGQAEIGSRVTFTKHGNLLSSGCPASVTRRPTLAEAGERRTRTEGQVRVHSARTIPTPADSGGPSRQAAEARRT